MKPGDRVRTDVRVRFDRELGPIWRQQHRLQDHHIALRRSDAVGIVRSVNQDAVFVLHDENDTGAESKLAAYLPDELTVIEPKPEETARERRATKPRPAYYAAMTIQPEDAIVAWGLGFNLGNVIKYVARAGKKTPDPLPDLLKARDNLDSHIERLLAEKGRSGVQGS
jgi:hypothetical protein